MAEYVCSGDNPGGRTISTTLEDGSRVFFVDPLTLPLGELLSAEQQDYLGWLKDNPAPVYEPVAAPPSTE